MNGTMEDVTQAQPFVAGVEKREPRLLDRVRDALRVRHMSLRTEKTYIHWIRRFILFHQKRHPKDMAEAEINAFLTHLAVEGRVSPSTQTQALCAILFLYRHVLDREIGELEGLVRARRTRRLPVVLTPEEVKSILSHIEGVDHLFLSLLYGTGMRLMEALRLRVKDIDFTYDQITVRDGKGAKDRVTMLPASFICPTLWRPSIPTLRLSGVGSSFSLPPTSVSTLKLARGAGITSTRGHRKELSTTPCGRRGSPSTRPVTLCAIICHTSPLEWLRHQDCAGASRP